MPKFAGESFLRLDAGIALVGIGAEAPRIEFMQIDARIHPA